MASDMALLALRILVERGNIITTNDIVKEMTARGFVFSSTRRSAAVGRSLSSLPPGYAKRVSMGKWRSVEGRIVWEV